MKSRPETKGKRIEILFNPRVVSGEAILGFCFYKEHSNGGSS